MATGFQITNQSGNIQIDDSFRNLIFKRKGVAYANTVLDMYTAYIESEPDEFIAISCKQNDIFAPRQQFITLENKNLLIVGCMYKGCQVDYYIFGYIDNPKLGNCIEVKNSSGKTVFTDNEKFMVVVASECGTEIRGNDPTNNFIIKTTLTPLGRKLALIPGAMVRTVKGKYYTPGDPGHPTGEDDEGWLISFFATQAFSFHLSNLESIYLQVLIGNQHPTIVGKVTQYNYLIIDVTEF